MDKYKLDPFIIVYKFKVFLYSPLLVGSGESENSDTDVIKDKNGVPFIPATSLSGVLRHHIKKYYDLNVDEYFGYSNNNGDYSSKIIFTDLLPEGDVRVTVRDGIRIDNKTGLTEDKAKFDYEIIEPESVFESYIEIHYNKPNSIKQIIKTIERDLKDKKIKIGSKTNVGFGEISFKESKVSFYDLRKKEDAIKWIAKEDNITTLDDVEGLEYKYNDLTIEFKFFIKDSVIVRYYSSDAYDVDSTHITSNGKYIIPGPSIKGAIRARAERILNTLNIKNKEKLLRYLLGESFNKENKASIPSRVTVNEVIIEQEVEADIQKRIKIDRFTGGAINGALFDSMPIFAKEYNAPNIMRITIKDPIEAEIGLILLILKDLWTGDLLMGGEKNIGRGALKGFKISIDYKDWHIKDKSIVDLANDKEKIQKYINELINADKDISEHFNEFDDIYKEVLNA